MRVLSIDELREVKGIRYSRAHIYRLIRRDQFPRPIRLGEQRIAFVEDEIDAWLKSKMQERDAPAGKNEITRRSSNASEKALKRHASPKPRRAAR